MIRIALVSRVEGAPSDAVTIGPAGLTIGRAEQCDLHLPDPRVSAQHARLEWEEGQLVLVHLSRTNSTRVNGQVVEERCGVREGDRITLAETVELEVVAAEAKPEQRASGAETRDLFVAIVGSGPAGLATAVQAATRGVPHVLLERRSLANTIERYQKGKLVMAEPTRLGLQSGLKVRFQQAKREQVLEDWSEAVRSSGAVVRVGPEHELVRLEGERGAFRLHLKGGDAISATHVVIAIGVQGNLRRFGVPGDDLPHVSHQLDDPAEFEGQKIVVVGAGDAGIENALALAEYDNEVSLVNRREEFDRAKAANRSALDAEVAAGRITLYRNTTVDHFEERAVFLKTPDGLECVEADLVIGRLGAIPPRKFLEVIGIALPSSSPEAVPIVSQTYESNVPGVHLVGAVAGYPLIKNCLNQGYEVIEHIAGHAVVPADEPVLADVLAPLGLPVAEAIARIRATVPLFGSLTPIQLREFFFDSKLRRVAKGATIYERNDFDNTLLAIVEGSVRVTAPRSPEAIRLELDEESRTRLLGNRNAFEYGPGDFFGEIGLLSGRRRGETAVAVTDCVLVESPRLAMNRLLNSSPEVRKAIDAAFAEHALERLMPGVTAENRRGLAAQAVMRTYDPDEFLFREGEPADGLYLIRRGSVALSQRRDGREVVLQYLLAGNLIGERGLVTGKRSASARAKTLVEALWIYTECIDELFSREPSAREFLRAQVAKRVGASAAAAADAHRGTVMFLIDQTGAYEATDLLLIDESLCIRCNNCEKACAETHGGISRLDREAGPTYQSSSGAQLHVPTACQHCENPKCMDDCPPDALQRDPNGEVYVRDNCIGCGACARNCPYGVIQMASLEPYRPKGLLWRLLLGEQASTPSAGDDSKKKAVKCDLCMELPDPRGGRKKAACVASCPTGAIVRADPRRLVDEILSRA